MRMFVVACVLMVFQFGAARAQNEAAFGIAVEPEVARVGEAVTVWIDVTLSGDWHIYSTTLPPGRAYPHGNFPIGRGVSASWAGYSARADSGTRSKF